MDAGIAAFLLSLVLAGACHVAAYEAINRNEARFARALNYTALVLWAGSPIAFMVTALIAGGPH